MKKTILLAIAVLMFSACAQAANVEVVLDSSNGTSGFRVQSSDLTKGATLDSGGLFFVKGLNFNGTVVNAGAGAMMLYYPKKAAFRAGNLECNDSNIGQYSIALGNGPIASGSDSVAIGNGTTASGSYALALGHNSVAAAQNSVAIGTSNTSNAESAIVIGKGIDNSVPNSIALGYSSVIHGQPDFLFTSEGTSYLNADAGNVSIGTREANDKLTVNSGGASIAIRGKFNDNNYGYLGASNVGVYGRSYGTGSFYGVYGTTTLGYAVYAHATGTGTGLYAYSGGGLAGCFMGGNVAIGDTVSSGYKLRVADTVTGCVALFENLDTGVTGDGIKILIGPNDNPGTGNHFISFCDGNGTEIGSVKGTGAVSVNYSTTGGDYAEYFDAEEDVPPGYLVGLNVLSGKARAWRLGDPLMGVVSIAPGFTGNADQSRV